MDNSDNEIIERINDLYRKKGFYFCCILALTVILICLICHYLWNLKINVHVEAIGSYTSVLEHDEEISVIKKSSLADHFSVMSPVYEFCYGINDTTEAIKVTKELSDLCRATKIKKQLLLIPKGAGYTQIDSIGLPEMDNFAIYLWKEKGEYCLFKREYVELHALMVWGGKYIYAFGQVNLLGFDGVVEIGDLDA